MRNAVDHPRSSPGGELIAADFTLTGTSPALELIDPTWGLSGDPQRAIVPEMDAIIEESIRLGEDILAGLFHKLKGTFPLALYELPVEARDPEFLSVCALGSSRTLGHEDTSALNLGKYRPCLQSRNATRRHHFPSPIDTGAGGSA